MAEIVKKPRGSKRYRANSTRQKQSRGPNTTTLSSDPPVSHRWKYIAGAIAFMAGIQFHNWYVRQWNPGIEKIEIANQVVEDFVDIMRTQCGYFVTGAIEIRPMPVCNGPCPHEVHSEIVLNAGATDFKNTVCDSMDPDPYRSARTVLTAMSGK